MTIEQLRENHGTPEQFMAACLLAVPSFISVDEAMTAAEKYAAEYMAADEAED